MIGAAYRRIRLAGELTRTLGPGWMVYRAKHAAELRTGLIERRLPATAWDEAPLANELTKPALADPDAYLTYRRHNAPAFFFAPQDRATYAPLLRGWDSNDNNPIRSADDLKLGLLRLFSRTPTEIGQPPKWLRNPLTGENAPIDRHFSRLDDFAYGDIKAIWEPSRFTFTYDLVRAYWRTVDDSYAECFWTFVENWREANPPQCGPNWKCGQETSFRVMSWCFGLYGFLESPATTPTRVARLAEMIARSGHRIDAMIDYALSQQNNHGISEGVGLWTIGSLFPEFRVAELWRERGRTILEQLGKELIYEDGSFSQHSLNYHRVMLHDYLWSMRLGELHGRPFSPALYRRIAKAGEFLYQLQDETTGRVPCYGANDGALILPLSNSDYTDFRPVTQATRYLTNRIRTYEPGTWDEETHWLFGEGAVTACLEAPERRDLRANIGGYITLRSKRGFAFTRCAKFRHRPGHADLLHVDLWWRGINVALDPGTHSYNSPAPWNNGLASTANHNTLAIDGRDQMDKVGRFLWLPWVKGVTGVDTSSEGGFFAYWEGEHDGYQRLRHPATHRRGILRIGDEHWLILDEARSNSMHDFRLQWLLPDFPHRIEESTAPENPLQTSVTLITRSGDYSVSIGSLGHRGRVSVVRADREDTRGWKSAYYLERTPAVSVAFEVSAPSIRMWTLFGPSGSAVTLGDNQFVLSTGSEQVELLLGTDSTPLLRRASSEGITVDRFEVDR